MMNDDSIIEILESIIKDSDDKIKARAFCKDVQRLGKKYGLSYFFVTEGASCTMNNGNPAVRNARLKHEEWERNHGYDPDEDWSEDKR